MQLGKHLAPRGVSIVAGLALFVLLLGAYWFLLRDPSPESEVRKFFAGSGLGEVVAVEDCGYVEADSTYDLYWCDLTATRRVELPHDRALPEGMSRSCFIVPRANRSFLGDTDDDAIPAGLADRDGGC
jgi:hypothetical protein